MELNIRMVGDILVIMIPEEVDSGNAGEVNEAIGQLMADNVNRLVFDFTGNEYISTAGLRVFLETLNKIKARKGKMSMFGMNELVYEVFDITGFVEVFAVKSGEEEAMAAVS